MYKWNKRLSPLLLLFVCAGTLAQGAVNPDKGEGFMRSEGKIYVVMAIVITLLAGFFYYLIRLDRKISRLENKKDL